MHALSSHHHAADSTPSLDALNAADRASLSERWLLLEFQAMLRAEGLGIDLKRLQLDPGYAQACLGRAFESSNAELRLCARRLSTSFLLDC